MLRLITTRRLRLLEEALAGHRLQQLEHVRHEERLRGELAHVRQTLERAERESVKWEARASRFIDDIGQRDGILSRPAMAEPAPTLPSDTRRVMSALGKTELTRRPHPDTPGPTTAGVIGVDAAAAAAAIADVIGR